MHQQPRGIYEVNSLCSPVTNKVPLLRDEVSFTGQNAIHSAERKNMFHSVFHSVYVLLSLKDCKFYTGYTTDLKQRVKDHNAGKNTSTKNRRPLKLIYFEGYLNKTDATKREIFLKSGSGKKFINKQLANYLNEKITKKTKQP